MLFYSDLVFHQVQFAFPLKGLIPKDGHQLAHASVTFDSSQQFINAILK